MRSRFGGTMATIVLSSVLSASVAVVVTQVVAPQYASAKGKTHSKEPTLASLSKTLSSDYKATQAQLSVIESDLAGLKTSVGAVSSNASAANTNASAADSAVSAITPVVHTIAERLYDTCALTSDLWGRSFPDADGQTGGSWTETIEDQTGDEFVLAEDLGRCYKADSEENGGQAGGILPAGAEPDDAWDAPVR
jgi:hypothetical protein